MAGLRELRKRLKSVRTTGQFAGAMRTVAAAKYSRAGTALAAYREYASACSHMLAMSGGFTAPQSRSERRCLVVLSGNRGFCGGFNAELTVFFHREYGREQTPLVVACGRAAAYCRDKGIPVEREFHLPDIPSPEESRELTRYVRGLYEAGEVGSVEFVFQKFVNMLTQQPERRQVLPLPQTGSAAPALCLPDTETVGRQLYEASFDAQVYALTLENAAGAQAATLLAMRSAYDNAQQAASDLELTINRRRQTEVTAGVLETSADNE